MVILNKLVVVVVVVEFPLAGVPRRGRGCPFSCPLSLSELVHVSNFIPRLLSVVPSHQGIPEATSVSIASGFDFGLSLDGFLLKLLASCVLL